MWHFRKKSAGEKIRNPIQGEFFAQDAISGPAQALVRESVQNSLDAANGSGPVRVCLTLVAGAAALPPDRVAGVFDGAWPHYSAPGNGLHAAPAPDAPCPYLLIEDYGTRGLTGDPSQSDPDPDPDRKNAFFLFFRAEGLSAKSGTELGRWGVGKFVFPRSSLASTHFGVTVRHDDGRRLLLGAVTLKAHRIAGDDAMYTPDGLYGITGNDDFVHPIEDQAQVDRFCALFGVTRTTEPGLSVVVPYIDESDITFEALLSAAARDYFLPILVGDLEITVTAGEQLVTLTASTLKQAIATDPRLSAELLPLVELAEFSNNVTDEDRIVLAMHAPNQSAKWTDELVPPESLTTLRAKLAARETIAIRVLVTVRPKKPPSSIDSWFDIYLRPDKDSDGRPVFVREGIIISDVRGRRATEIRSLVVIGHRALGGMLGDSENPAHTQWQRDSSNFKGRYTYGKAVIDFVTDSVASLLAIVNRSAAEVDTSLTIDFFSIEPPEDSEDSEDGTSRRRRPKKGQDAGEEPIKVEAKPTRIRISRSNRGFSVLPGSAPPAPPFLILVRCAYETRTGNALKKWDAADFTLGESGLPVSCEGGVNIAAVRDNQLILQVTGTEFRASVTGFDTKRDVFVRAEVKETSSAGPEA
jgi:hypothetical protein